MVSGISVTGTGHNLSNIFESMYPIPKGVYIWTPGLNQTNIYDTWYLTVLLTFPHVGNVRPAKTFDLCAKDKNTFMFVCNTVGRISLTFYIQFSKRTYNYAFCCATCNYQEKILSMASFSLQSPWNLSVYPKTKNKIVIN